MQECNFCKRINTCTINDIVLCGLLGYIYFEPEEVHISSDLSSDRKKLITLLRGHSLDTEDDITYVADLLLQNGFKIVRTQVEGSEE